MSAPILTRPWQFCVNQLYRGRYSAGFSLLSMCQETLWGIKEILKGGGGPWTSLTGAPVVPTGNWSVSFSSDSTVLGTGTPGDGVDYWTDPTKLIWNGGGGAGRSWIVLRQPGIAPNYELCIHLNVTGNAMQATFVVSPNARFGFGGAPAGSNTARPQANDELVIANIADWGPSGGIGVSTRAHVLKSGDGASTRVIFARNGYTCGLWAFEQPGRYSSGWQNPSVSLMYATSTEQMSSTLLTSASLCTTAGAGSGRFFGRSLDYPNGVGFQAYLLNPASTPFAPTGQTGPNDMDDETPFWPLDLWSTNAFGARGRAGTLADMWISLGNFQDGTQAPFDDTRQFLQLSSYVIPWNRSIARWY